MSDAMLRIAITSGFFLIVYMIIEYKTKNFIPEKLSILFMLVMMIVLRLVNITSIRDIDELYDEIIFFLIPIVILGGYIIFQKNKIFFFRGIDKKLIEENRNEITNIIRDYKYNYIDYKAKITFVYNKIVFEDVKKTQVEECLSLISSFLDENRKKYTFTDYLIYFTKSLFIPIVIAIAAVFLLAKFTRYIL